jgi:alpha-galactosidase
MGYNTWNDFRCHVTATDLFNVVDTFKSLNLRKYGYEYINLDDCWAKNRDKKGKIQPDSGTFPNGMKAVADYVHAHGYKFGIYTDRGNATCAGRPGSLKFENIDAQVYADWGVDYLKEDSCWATGDHQKAFAQYAAMRDALNRTGRPIYFSLCGWSDWYSPVGWTLGNSWRIAGDCNKWPDVIHAINVNAPLTKNARPGGWNDPDMLLGSNTKNAAYLPAIQSRTMFSMWAVMTAPLLLGTSHFNAFDLETVTNDEVIAVNQDPLGVQGTRIKGDTLTPEPGNPDNSHINIWAKPLNGGKSAAVFISTASSSTSIQCDVNCFAAMGFKPNDILSARDLWKHTVIDNHVVPSNGFSVTVDPNGGSVSIVFSK